LLWIYLLVVAGLIGVGLSAGKRFYSGYLPLAFEYQRAVVRCGHLLKNGVIEHPGLAVDPAMPDYFACLDPQRHLEAAYMLAAAGAVLILAAALVVLVPVWDLQRLRSHRPGFASEAAVRRFSEICDQRGLIGRRRPRLLLAGPMVREPFTVGLVGRRPVLVMPLAMAFPDRDPAVFDAVVHHELGHVLARDVAWVPMVRCLTWLTGAVTILAVLPDLQATMFPIGSALPLAAITSLAQALLFILLSGVLSAALLRRREYEADAFAAGCGHHHALTRLFDRPARSVARRFRLMARHPNRQARSEALRNPDRLRDGTLFQGLFTGAVTSMVAGQTVLLMDLFETSLPSLSGIGNVPSGIGAVISGLLLGGFAPALGRRRLAAQACGRPARWWVPTTGLGVGFVVGAYACPGLPMPFTTTFPARSMDISASWPWFILSAIAIGAASYLVIAHLPSGMPTPALYVGSAALYTGVLRIIALPASAPGSWIKVTLAFSVHRDIWAYLILVLPVTGLLVRVVGRPRRTDLSEKTREPGPFESGRSGGRTAAVGVLRWAADPLLIGLLVGAVGIAQVWLVEPDTMDQHFRMYEQHAWLQALTGLVVTIVRVTRSNDPSAFAQDLLSGVPVIVLSGLMFLLNSAMRGVRADRSLLMLDVARPLTWMLAFLVIAAPLCLRLSRSSRRTRGFRPEPLLPARSGVPIDPWSTDLRPAPGRHRFRRPLHGRPGSEQRLTPRIGVVLTVAALTAGLFGPAFRYLYVPGEEPDLQSWVLEQDWTDTARSQGAASESVAAAADTASIGNASIAAQLEQATESVGPLLPRWWSAVPAASPSQGSTTSGTAAWRPASCSALAEGTFERQLPEPLAAAESDYSTHVKGDVPGGQIQTLSISVKAYRQEVPRSFFRDAWEAESQCDHWSMPGDLFDITFRPDPRAVPLKGFEETSWRVDYTTTTDFHYPTYPDNHGTMTMVMVGVGDMLVTVGMSSIEEKREESVLRDAISATIAAVGSADDHAHP